MTNADIIKGLKALRTIHNGNYAPFIDGAIKELEKESCDDWSGESPYCPWCGCKMQEVEEGQSLNLS